LRLDPIGLEVRDLRLGFAGGGAEELSPRKEVGETEIDDEEEDLCELQPEDVDKYRDEARELLVEDEAEGVKAVLLRLTAVDVGEEVELAVAAEPCALKVPL